MTGEQAARFSLDLTRSFTYAWDKPYRRDLLVVNGIAFPS
jgi:hypothetical protein